jgi:TPR repeat protein
MKKLLLFFLLLLGYFGISNAASPEMEEILDYYYSCEKSILPGCKYYTAPHSDKKTKKAMNIWLPIAEKGNAEAQWRLGSEYIETSFTFTDDAVVIKFPEIGRKALYWLTKSAEQGYQWAQLELGMSFGDTDYHGLPILKDPKKQIYWLKLAANQDNAYAANQLSHIYELEASMAIFLCINRGECKLTPAVRTAKYWIQKTNNLGFPINASKRWNRGQYWKFD